MSVHPSLMGIPPGMEWVLPPGVAGAAPGSLVGGGLGNTMLGASPELSRRAAMSQARESRSGAASDRVRAEIERLQALTAADLDLKRAQLDRYTGETALRRFEKQEEYRQLKERYPHEVAKLEAQTGIYESRLAQEDEKLDQLKARYPVEMMTLQADLETAKARTGEVDARTAAIESGVSRADAAAAGDAEMAAEELRQLKERYPVEMMTLQADLETAKARTGEVDARTAAIESGVSRADAAAAGDAEMAAEELRQLEERYPQEMALLTGKIATEGARRESIERGTASNALMADERLRQLQARYPADMAKLEAQTDASRALAESRRSKIAGTGPDGQPQVPGPYSAEANRVNDDIRAVVDARFGRDVLVDPVSGEMMVGTDPLRGQRIEEVTRAAQNIFAVEAAKGRPITPDNAVTAAVAAMRRLHEGGSAAPGVPGAPAAPQVPSPAPPAPQTSDPLNIRRTLTGIL